jgi:lipoprotein signal peptidase
MNKFLNNLLDIFIYTIIFVVFLWIYNPNLSVREYIGLGLIIGFFAGMINNIDRTLKNKE